MVFRTCKVIIKMHKLMIMINACTVITSIKVHLERLVRQALIVRLTEQPAIHLRLTLREINLYKLLTLDHRSASHKSGCDPQGAVNSLRAHPLSSVCSCTRHLHILKALTLRILRQEEVKHVINIAHPSVTIFCSVCLFHTHTCLKHLHKVF